MSWWKLSGTRGELRSQIRGYGAAVHDDKGLW